MKNIRLGDVLIEFGYITPDQLNTALAYQKEHRDLRVGQALQELGYVNERQVLEANLRKSITPPTSGSSYVKLRF